MIKSLCSPYDLIVSGHFAHIEVGKKTTTILDIWNCPHWDWESYFLSAQIKFEMEQSSVSEVTFISLSTDKI